VRLRLRLGLATRPQHVATHWAYMHPSRYTPVIEVQPPSLTSVNYLNLHLQSVLRQDLIILVQLSCYQDGIGHKIMNC